MWRRRLAVAGALAIACGCTVTVERRLAGRRIDPREVEAIRVGEDDAGRVLERLGPPDRIEAEPRGDVYHYAFVDSLDVVLEFPPPLDVGITGALAQTTVQPAGLYVQTSKEAEAGGTGREEKGVDIGAFAASFQRARSQAEEEASDHLRLEFDAGGRLVAKTFTFRTLGPPALRPRTTRWTLGGSVEYVPMSRDDAGRGVGGLEYREAFFDGLGLEGQLAYHFLPFLCAFAGGGYRRAAGRSDSAVDANGLRTLRFGDWVQVPMFVGLRLEIPFGLSWRQWATMPYPPRLSGFVPYICARGGIVYSKRVGVAIERPGVPAVRDEYFGRAFLPEARFAFGLQYRWRRLVAFGDVGVVTTWPPPSRSGSLDSEADRLVTYPVRFMLAVEF